MITNGEVLIRVEGLRKSFGDFYALDGINEEIRKFEEEEIKNMSDTMAMLKIQKALEKPEDYNSDEDSLNGWDYRVDLD